MITGAGLVSADAGRWSLVQDMVPAGAGSGRWFRTGSCWWLLVQEGDHCCKKVVDGAGLVTAGVGR